MKLSVTVSNQKSSSLFSILNYGAITYYFHVNTSLNSLPLRYSIKKFAPIGNPIRTGFEILHFYELGYN